jgi:rare lipoprotein A
MKTPMIRGLPGRCAIPCRAVSLRLILQALVPVLVVNGCTTRLGSPVGGMTLTTQIGLASFYGAEFEGQRTSSGEPFDPRKMVAAHPVYPFGTQVQVINLENGRAVQVRVIDRGPEPQRQREGVVIDVSEAAAEQLDFVIQGRARVRLEVLAWG